MGFAEIAFWLVAAFVGVSACIVLSGIAAFVGCFMILWMASREDSYSDG